MSWAGLMARRQLSQRATSLGRPGGSHAGVQLLRATKAVSVGATAVANPVVEEDGHSVIEDPEQDVRRAVGRCL